MYKDMTDEALAVALRGNANLAHPYDTAMVPQELLREAARRIDEGRKDRRMLAFLTAAYIVIVLGGGIWLRHLEPRPQPQPCPGPTDTKVVPLNPTEIRAARSAPVWL